MEIKTIWYAASICIDVGLLGLMALLVLMSGTLAFTTNAMIFLGILALRNKR